MPGDYQQLRQRIAEEPGARRGSAWLPWLAVAATVACVAGAGGVWLANRPGTSPAASVAPAGQAEQTPDVTRSSVRTTSPSATATRPVTGATGNPVAAGGRALPVYWVAPADRPGFALYREFYASPVVGAQQAVDAMLTRRPADPDYDSPWRPAPAKVTVSDGLIVVDLGHEAFSAPSVSADLAE